jgi:hypothetical protein
MKRRRMWALLLVLVLGVVAGFCLGLWLLSPVPEPKRALVLSTFDFHQAAPKAGNATWKVIHDDYSAEQDGNWYYLGPWKGESSVMTRVIVARTRMSGRERLRQPVPKCIERSSPKPRRGLHSGPPRGQVCRRR